MRKILFFFALSFWVLLARGEDKKQTRKEFKAEKQEKIEGLLRKELDLVNKLLKSRRRDKATLLFRKIGIFKELLKIRFEEENQKFIAATLKKGGKPNKKTAFPETQRLYKFILGEGFDLVKKYPKYRLKGELYFELGVVSRDYGHDGKAVPFFKRALKNSKKDSKLYIESMGSLADFYYNEKKYKEAIRLYERLVTYTEHEWYPKYNYNLAWCYLKKKHFKLAIRKMKVAFEQSGQEGSLNIKPQVLDNIGLFFAFGNEVHKGIDFYLKNSPEPIRHLHKMGSLLQERGLFNLSELTYDSALKHNKDKKKEVELKLSKLSLYHDFNKIEQHYKMTANLFELYKDENFKAESKEDYIQKMNLFVNNLQVKVTKKLYAYRPELLRERKHMVINYFDILRQVDLPNATNYLFFMGETYYGLSEFDKAIPYYDRAIDQGVKDKKEDKLLVSIFDSILASLGNSETSRSVHKKYLVGTYQKYLEIFPKGEKADPIYKKLFNQLYERKEIAGLPELIEKYHKNFPKEVSFQRGMVTRLVEHHLKNQAHGEISLWIKKLKTGYLSFDKSVIQNMEVHLGKVLFTKNQKLVTSNKSDVAAENYKKLFNNPIYTDSIKGKSAFNLAIILLKDGKTHQAAGWFLNSLNHLDDKDYAPLHAGLEASAVEIFFKGDQGASLALGEALIKRNCQDPKKKWSSFQLWQISALSSGEKKRVDNLYKLISNCVSLKKETVGYYKNVLNYLTFPEHLEKLENYPWSFWTQKGLGKELYNKLYTVFHELPHSQYSGKRDELWDYLQEIKKDPSLSQDKEVIQFFTAYEKVDQYKEKIENFIESEYEVEETFNEAKFNNWLKTSIQGLTDLANEGNSLMNLGAPEVSIEIATLIEKAHSSLSNKIFSFTPKGKDPGYIKGFKGTMGQMARTLGQKGAAFAGVKKNIQRQLGSPIVSENPSRGVAHEG